MFPLQHHEDLLECTIAIHYLMLPLTQRKVVQVVYTSTHYHISTIGPKHIFQVRSCPKLSEMV